MTQSWPKLVIAAMVAFYLGHCGFCQDSIKESPITESDRDHWAFKPIILPALPTTRHAAENPIDAFILAKLEEKQLYFAPPADRRTLLRRLSFDLIGLPPTDEEITTFEADRSPLAYEKQVDRLLASPQHGQRAALFWLDLARFAETDGFEHDLVRPDAWKYRDWVINAFNQDQPYDEFTKAQLAGDELGNENDRIATMFCLAGPDMPDLNDQHLRRHDRLNELTSTVGSVFLGLQMGCAQCHDHKYDPLSQADFYRLRALFEPAIPELKRDKAYNVFATSKVNPKPRFWIRGDHTRPGPELVAAYPRIAVRENSAAPAAADSSARSAFADWLASPANPLFARVAANRLWQQLFGKGIFATPSDAGLVGIAPTHEELLDWLAIELRENDWSMKSLRRKIVTSQTYRQASRATGEPQTNADWQNRLQLNPENSLYSRFPRRRLEGEAIRDTMLFAAGELNLTHGGPGIMVPLPQELTNTLLKGQWTESKNKADHVRRSIYLFARRNLRYPLFEAFDRPDANESCPLRNRSTTPSQAFVLLHGDFPIEMSGALAKKACDDAPEQTEGATQKRIANLFRRVLQRNTTPEERARLTTFFKDQAKQIAVDHPDWTERQGTEACLADLALALMNSSEFSYLD